MSDEQTQTTTTETTGAVKDAAYWQAEAKKAFEDRDAAKQKAKDYSARALSDEDRELFATLKKERELIEEDKKRKSGEFDQWRTDILKKHQSEIADRDKRVTDAETRTRKTLIGLAFAGAADVFGKDGLTIYGPAAGERIFSDYVDLGEDGTVVVKNRTGNVILDAETGKPASFGVAMRELVESLPDKHDHLRGSGKTGSGSSGGGQPGGQADVTELTQRARNGDKAALDALRARRANSGQLQMGTAFSK